MQCTLDYFVYPQPYLSIEAKYTASDTYYLLSRSSTVPSNYRRVNATEELSMQNTTERYTWNYTIRMYRILFFIRQFPYE